MRFPRPSSPFVWFLLLIGLVAAPPAKGQTTVSGQDERGGFWDRWFRRSDQAKEEQPHWITPLATTTPRLEQEFRYDVNWSQAKPGGAYTENIGNAKGLELIPGAPIEVIAAVPAYVMHNNPAVADGWGDFSLLVKYRMLSANEQQGNYIVTAFLSESFPTGTNHNGQLRSIVTPTLAFGKGWDDLDTQGTVGAAEPVGLTGIIGRTYTWNQAVQAHLPGRLWPELEVNQSWFSGGKNDGKEQTFLTPGVVVGKTPLIDRLGLTFGAGVQVAVSKFHTSNHTIIVSARTPF